MKNAEQQIDYIITHFNFHRVKSVMEFLNWKYWDSEGIPTVSHLQSIAFDLLRTVAKEKQGWVCSTGGFTARNLGHRLELVFDIEHYDSEGY